MARRRKRGGENTAPKTYDAQAVNRKLGYSDKALKALEAGRYDELTGRDPMYTRSEDQIKVIQRVPALKGMTSVKNSTAERKNTSVKKSTKERKNYIDTERARKKYADRNVPSVDMEFTKQISAPKLTDEKAKPVLSKDQSELIKGISGEKSAPIMDEKQKNLTASIKEAKDNAPKATGVASARREKQENQRDKNYVVKRDRYGELMKDAELADDIRKLSEINYKNADQDATVSQEWAEEYGAKHITGGLNKKDFVDSLTKKYGLTPAELNDMALTYHADENNAEVAGFGERAQDISKAHPIAGSLGSFVGTVGSGIEGIYNNVVGGITGDDRYLSNMFRTAKNAPREGVKENLESDVAKGAYDIGMGIGDMAAGAATGSAPLTLAGNTANEALYSAMDRGSSVRQASAYGTSAGITDFITNKVGLDKAKEAAIKGLKSAGIVKFLKSNAIAGLGEAGENVIQDLAQSFLDHVINGKNSEIRLALEDKMNNGASYDDAISETVKEYAGKIGLSALTGFGMGSVMHGGKTALNNLPELYGLTQSKKLDRLFNRDKTIQAILHGETPSRAEVEQLQADARAEVENKSMQKLQEQLEKPVNPVAENPADAINARIAEEAEATQSPEKLQIPVEKPGDFADNLAARFTRTYADFDGYDYMDNISEVESQMAQMADDIRNGKDLSDYIGSLEEDIENAPDVEIAQQMRTLIDELSEIQNRNFPEKLQGEVGKVPNNKVPEPSEILPETEDIIEDVAPETNTRAYSDEELAELNDFVSKRDALLAEADKHVNMFDLAELTKMNELHDQARGMEKELAQKYPELFDERGKFQGVPEKLDKSAQQGYNDDMTEGGVENGTDNESEIQSRIRKNITGNGQGESYNAESSRVDENPQGLLGRGNNGVLGEPSVTPEIRKKMNDAGISDYGLRRTTDAARFSSALDEGRKLENNSHGVFVSAKSPEDVQKIIDEGGKVFLTDDNTAGLIVTADGDIEGVFNNSKLAKDLGKTAKSFNDLMTTAIANGGKKLDCYGEFLAHLYASVGLEPVAGSKYLKGKEWSAEMDSWKQGEASRKGLGSEDDINTDVYFFKLRDGWTVDDVIEAIKTGSLTEYANNLDLSLEKVNENLPDEYRNIPEDDEYDALLGYRDSLMGQPSKITPPTGNPEAPLISDTVTSGDKGESRVVTHSAINADVISRFDYENDPVLKEIAEYDKHSNEKTYNAALEAVKRNGGQLLEEYNTDRRLIDNDTDVDQAMLLLRNLNEQIKANPEDAEGLTAQKNMLLSRLRKAGTKWGESIQAFAKWNDTPEGALINGQRMDVETTKAWASNNQEQVKKNKEIANALDNIGREEITKPPVKTDTNKVPEITQNDVKTNKTSALMDKALREQGNDGTIKSKTNAPKTHDQVRAEVENSLKKELGSVYKNMTETDLEYYTSLVENKVPVEQIVDEIEHRLNHGEFYTIDESIEEPKQLHGKLLNALNSLVETEEVAPKRELSMDELREQVRNTFDRESSSIGEFTDEDVDYVANLINDGATKEELAQALNTKMATGRFGISADTQNKVNQLFEYADHFDPNSKQAVKAKAAAYKLIAEEVVGDASPFEKFEAWRYLAMLGNPKTMLRNFVGNTLFNVTTGVSNNVSALGESLVDNAIKLGKKGMNKAFNTNFDTSKGIQRTKSVLVPGLDHDLIKGAWRDAAEKNYARLNGTKYEKGSVKDKIKGEKSVFKSKGMQAYENLVDVGISDYPAIKTKYSTSLAGWMKANGLDADAFDAESKYKNLQAESRHRVLTDSERAEMKSLKETVKTLEKGRQYALEQAEYATFHEDNAIAQAISNASNKLIRGENSTKGTRALGYMLEGLVPFKKTPANILRSGIEYSPLGAIKSIAKTGKLVYENTGKRRTNLDDTYTKKSWWRGNDKEVSRTLASDVIDSWSKTLTGTGLAYLGYYLKSKGILNSSEKDEKYQDDLEGVQNYSITINGKTYTLDWAAPAVMPLLLGAEVKKAFERNAIPDKKWYTDVDGMAETLNSLLDPLFETSMMQGVQNMFESAANASRYGDGNEAVGGVLGSVATNALTGYYTQAIPTLSGQIARTVDPVRRSTDTATDSNFLAGVEKQGRKLMNKTPFLSKLNTPYVDARGEQQANSPFNNVGANLAYQMLSPSYIRDIDTRPSDIMARQVYNATTKNEEGRDVPIRDKNVFAPWKSKVTYGGQKLTPEQMQTYREKSGQAGEQIRTALAKEPWFNNLNGDQQTELVKKVNTLVNKIGLEANGFEQTDKALDAYKKNIPSLMDYYHGEFTKKDVNNAAEAAGLGTSTNAAKAAQAAAAKGNMEEAQQIIDQGVSDMEGAKATGYVNKDGNVLLSDYTNLVSEANNTDKMRNDLPKLAELGMEKTAYHTYARVINTPDFANVSPEEFAQTYNEINTNGKGVSQDEILAWVNQFDWDSPAEAVAYWNAYGQADWKSTIQYDPNTGMFKKVKK